MAHHNKPQTDFSLYNQFNFEMDENMAHAVLDSVLDNLDDLLLEHLPAPVPAPLPASPQLDVTNSPLPLAMSQMGSKTASYNSLTSLDTLSSAPERLERDSSRASLLSGCVTRIVPFDPSGSLRLQLKDYVFISKDCTRRLADYVAREPWGAECGLLYKYLDYIFRCQAFKRQTIEVDDGSHQFLVFHSGLQRRRDGEALFVLLVPNKKYVAQSWRVQFGNIRNSFVSRRELLAKLKEPHVVEDYLPQRTRFEASPIDAVYDHRLPIAVDWEERLTTNKDRLCRVLGSVAFFDRNWRFLRLSELAQAFEAALARTRRRRDIAPERLAVAQGFVDSKHHKFRMELLLPLSVEFPRGSGAWFAFALAIARQSDGEAYMAKSLLTMDMAYANARLVGYVRSEWLFYGAGSHSHSKRCKFK